MQSTFIDAQGTDMHPARIFTCLLQVSLMDEAGNTKDDLTLPKGTDDSDKLATQIQQDFDDGKELVVTVLKVSILFCKPFCCTAQQQEL